MGNTPLQSKRRLSGDLESLACDSTPPYIAVDIPSKKPALNYDNNSLRSDQMDSSLFCKSIPPEQADVSMLQIYHQRPITLSVNKGTCQSTSASDLSVCDVEHNVKRPISAEPDLLTSDIEMTPSSEIPSQKCTPTVFRWNGGGKEVYISGSFNNWRQRIPLLRRNSGACVIVDCPPGKHEYKFFIDGAWYHDPTKPTVDNKYGTKNNAVEVSESDYNFLNALEHDIANSRHKAPSLSNSDVEGRTPPGDYGCFIPELPNDVYPNKISLSPFANTRMGQKIPPAPGIGSCNQPPFLPPQLLQGILNKDVGVHCDPNLLPPPNHVMVNHLYALSIKDGVIVLSVITRYRQKFVSTLFYKPIPK